MVAVELVTVDALEHNALPVDLHQSVAQAELTEANAYAHDLLQRPRRVAHTNQKMIEERILCAPQVHTEGLSRNRMRLCGDARLILPYTVPILVAEQDLDVLLCRIAKREVHIELSVRVSVPFHRHCTDSDILDVVLRLRVERDITVDPREPPEILILQPARARIAEHHRCQLIFA